MEDAKLLLAALTKGNCCGVTAFGEVLLWSPMFGWLFGESDCVLFVSRCRASTFSDVLTVSVFQYVAVNAGVYVTLGAWVGVI